MKTKFILLQMAMTFSRANVKIAPTVIRVLSVSNITRNIGQYEFRKPLSKLKIISFRHTTWKFINIKFLLTSNGSCTFLDSDKWFPDSEKWSVSNTASQVSTHKRYSSHSLDDGSRSNCALTMFLHKRQKYGTNESNDSYITCQFHETKSEQ